MEAAGFVATAVRFSSLEWLRCYKIISDNKTSDPASIKPSWVQSLCQEALELIYQEIDPWLILAKEQVSRIAQIDCESIFAEYRLSVTEQHQLRRLLQRAITLGKLELDGYSDWTSQHPAKTGKQLLQALRQLLTDTEGAEN